jgi:hypothetical protein
MVRTQVTIYYPVTLTGFFISTMFICKGQKNKRVVLACTRFYSTDELFKIAREPNKQTPLWLEYGPNLYQEIKSDTELRFACALMEGDIDSNQTDEDREQHKRDVRDAADTVSLEIAMKCRKPRVKNTEPKICSKLHTQCDTSGV